MISRASGDFPPGLCHGSAGRLKAPPRFPAAGRSLHFVPQDLQTTDSGEKHINFDEKTQGKMGGNHKNSGRTEGK